VGIRHVCVDHGRLLIKEPSAGRVEGRTTFEPVAGTWFRCRLFYEGAPDQMDGQAAHWKAVPTPQILTTMRDDAGQRLDFHDDYRVQIRSNLGNHVWRLSGEPEPIRKKRRVIGWLLTVERVIERQYDDLLNENIPDWRYQ
jgi:hypothetical protein